MALPLGYSVNRLQKQFIQNSKIAGKDTKETNRIVIGSKILQYIVDFIFVKSFEETFQL